MVAPSAVAKPTARHMRCTQLDMSLQRVLMPLLQILKQGTGSVLTVKTSTMSQNGGKAALDAARFCCLSPSGFFSFSMQIEWAWLRKGRALLSN